MTINDIEERLAYIRGYIDAKLYNDDKKIFRLHKEKEELEKMKLELSNKEFEAISKQMREDIERDKKVLEETGVKSELLFRLENIGKCHINKG